MSSSFGFKISRAVEKYRGHIEPRSGDCGNIACSLNKFFDDAELISISNSPTEHNSVHFCVQIEGDLYDGLGKTTAKEMVECFSEGGLDDDFNSEDYLYSVSSVRSENYFINTNVRNMILENLEREFES